MKPVARYKGKDIYMIGDDDKRKRFISENQHKIVMDGKEFWQGKHWADDKNLKLINV